MRQHVATTLLVAAGLLAAPAYADQATTGGRENGTYDIRSLTAANNGTSVTATVRLSGLPAAGEAAFNLDTGVDDSRSMTDYHYWYVYVDKASGSRPTARLFHNNSVSGKSARACDVRVTWNRSEARIGVTVPTSCFGQDRGMMRVGFQGPDEVSHGTVVRTRPLQLGQRGATYGDVNGDGTVDTSTVRAVSEDSYELRVGLGNRVVSASGPLSWSGHTARVVSRLDVNKDGRAEVVVDAGDVGGGYRYHLFTLVRGDLVPVTKATGRLVANEAFTSGSGGEEYPDMGFRCFGRTLQTWQRSTGTDRVQVEVTTWTLEGSTATAGSTREVTLSRSVASQGSWSRGSCATR